MSWELFNESPTQHTHHDQQYNYRQRTRSFLDLHFKLLHLQKKELVMGLTEFKLIHTVLTEIYNNYTLNGDYWTHM